MTFETTYDIPPEVQQLKYTTTQYGSTYDASYDYNSTTDYASSLTSDYNNKYTY